MKRDWIESDFQATQESHWRSSCSSDDRAIARGNVEMLESWKIVEDRIGGYNWPQPKNRSYIGKLTSRGLTEGNGGRVDGVDSEFLTFGAVNTAGKIVVSFKWQVPLHSRAKRSPVSSGKEGKHHQRIQDRSELHACLKNNNLDFLAPSAKMEKKSPLRDTYLREAIGSVVEQLSRTQVTRRPSFKAVKGVEILLVGLVVELWISIITRCKRWEWASSDRLDDL